MIWHVLNLSLNKIWDDLINLNLKKYWAITEFTQHIRLERKNLL